MSSSECQQTSDENDTPTPQYRKPLSELFLVAKGFLGIDLAFHNYQNEPPVYNLEISGLVGRRNIVRLREGKEKRGAYFGQAEFDKFESRIELYVGKSEYGMTKEGKNTYRWNIIPSKTGEETFFVWRRMEKEVGNSESSFVNPDWKLVQEKSGEVHAVYVENMQRGSDRGKMQFRRSLGYEWEMAVLLTLGTMVERERQRRGRRGNFTTGMLAY